MSILAGMPADAASLHCPNCGAAADSAASRCPYCHARLATVSCPQCFALMFQGTAFCPQCGARAARVEAGAVPAACPACRGQFQRVAVGAASLLECGSCGGLWLDAAEFERVCADQAIRAAVLHRWNAPPPKAAVTEVRYRPCVRCGKMMNRVNFSRLSGTIVDVCRGHGTFLDAGELHAIVDFIHGGGLERTREKEIADLREEQRLLDAARARAHSASSGSARVELGTWNSGDLRQLLASLGLGKDEP